MSFLPSDPSASRRWLPAAIIGAAIVVAAGLISAALIFGKGRAADTNAAAASVNSAVDGPTCQAWKSARATIGLIPQLPRGWDWNTPNIDTLIGNRVAATTVALDLFEPKIAPAHDYVAGRRKELKMLTEHTYTTADGVAGNEALARLNLLCGLDP